MRFPEFTEEWETKKLGEISEKVNTKNKTNTVNVVFSNSAVQGIVLQNEYFDKNIANKDNLAEYYIVKPFDFVYNPRISSNAKVGAMSVNKTKKTGLVSPLYTVFRLNSNLINNSFIEMMFKSKVWHSHMRSIANYGARDDRMNIKSDDFFALSIKAPSHKEQEKISLFLSLLDERISTQNKIIEELKLLKITISKKLFSRQLRFKNGNNENYIDWNTKKLGEVTTLVNKRNKNNEKLPVYSINNRLGFVPQSEQFEGVDSEDRGYDIKLYKIIDKNIFAYNPARINVGSIGYSENLENIIISSLYVCFKTDNTVNDNFLYQYLKTDFFNREVLRNVEGGVRDYLFYDNFARIKFGLPCIEEQKKIADYLSSIDSKIDIESQLLHKFEKQKRYLLANLFI